MNKIGLLVRLATSQVGKTLSSTTSLLRPCVSHQNLRFLSSEEDDIEENATQEAKPKRLAPGGILMDRRGINISKEASIEYLKSDGNY